LSHQEQYLRRFIKTLQGINYLVAFSHVAVLSQVAHAALSQHDEPASHPPHPPLQPAAAGSAACSELLQHAHEAIANIAATTAIAINTFFIVLSINY